MNKGFTLIEIVVYMGVLVLVVGAVSSLLVWLVRANSNVHLRTMMAVHLEHALSAMSGEIREAQSVYAPTSALGSNPGQLSLETRKNPPAGETSTYVDFFLCGTRLCVKRESQEPSALTAENIEIQNIEFTQVQTGLIPSVHIVVEASAGGVSQSMQTTVSLRSYE